MLGAPRSGTSLLAGLLADAGLDPGADLIPPSEHNPRGFFESVAVNRINDELLGPVTAARTVPGASVPPERHLWLAAIDGPLEDPPPDPLVLRMRAALGRGSFVVKDPRMSYTLPQWEPALGRCDIVCVVRDPAEVVASVQAMVQREPTYYASFRPTTGHLLSMWEAVHRSIEVIATTRRVLWVHFDDLVHGDGAARLSVGLDLDVPDRRRDRALHRSQPSAIDVPEHLRARHAHLRHLCR